MKLIDLFCGAGGAAMGYYRAGFDEIVGVDIKAQPRYPFTFVQADALEYLAEHGHEFDAIHASPPCQGYSIMNNLPWLKGRDYPLLILPAMELLDRLGKPYILENVMGARHGAKGLKQRGLVEHGLQAGWLCGTMFGLPFYRHRLFASSFFWLQPGHATHKAVIQSGPLFGSNGGRLTKTVFSEAEDSRGIQSWPGRRGEQAGLAIRQYTRQTGPNAGKVETGTATGTTEPGYGMTQYGNGAQKEGCAVGHAKGWRLAAEAMGIDWMKRAELSQAIPPAYTEYIGKSLLAVVAA